MITLYDIPLYEQDLKTALENTCEFSHLAGKHVLITGATGLIGSYIADMICLWNRLQINENAKIHIYLCSRKMQHLRERFRGCWEKEKVHFIQQDFSMPLNLDSPADYIIHAAGNAYPAAFRKDPVGTILSNVVGTNNLLEYAVKKQTKRFLFVSSGEVYGEGDPSIDAFSEEYSGQVNILDPRSCYPLSKRAAENLCVSYSKQFNIDSVIVRPCHTYGPNITSSDNRATVQFMANALRNEDIVLKSQGTQLRSYCYIADCASALLSVLVMGKCGGAYNLANSESRITIADFAKKVANQSNTKVVFEIPDNIARAEQSPISKAVLASEKLELLGWKGCFDAELGIKHTYQIMKDLQYSKNSLAEGHL